MGLDPMDSLQAFVKVVTTMQGVEEAIHDLKHNSSGNGLMDTEHWSVRANDCEPSPGSGLCYSTMSDDIKVALVFAPYTKQECRQLICYIQMSTVDGSVYVLDMVKIEADRCWLANHTLPVNYHKQYTGCYVYV